MNSNGRVIALSRSRIFILLENLQQQVELPLKSKNLDAVVGDYCRVDTETQNFTILERTNLLSRSYGKKTKKLASNLDHLFIVNAIKPGINTVFIDRAISSCIYENIPFSIIINKSDLEQKDIHHIIDIYSKLNINIIYTSTKTENGFDSFKDYLIEKNFSTIALCGISGVGKSSLINLLAPTANSPVGTLSKKETLGKQTTSMSRLYMADNSNGSKLAVVDLPGLQHFGVCQIKLSALAPTFPEFESQKYPCKFNDCSHTIEPECNILKKLSAGLIAQLRYNSYLDMRREIENYGQLV